MFASPVRRSARKRIELKGHIDTGHWVSSLQPRSKKAIRGSCGNSPSQQKGFAYLAFIQERRKAGTLQ
jgi:hypothetical protein